MYTGCQIKLRPKRLLMHQSTITKDPSSTAPLLCPKAAAQRIQEASAICHPRGHAATAETLHEDAHHTTLYHYTWWMNTQQPMM
jgi:hypothetical protein